MTNLVLFDAPGPKAKRLSLILNILALVAVAAGIAWIIYTLAAPRVYPGANPGEEIVQPGYFDPSRWHIFFGEGSGELWGAIGQGVWATLSAAGVAAILALLIGMVFALLSNAPSRWVRIPTTVVLEFFRGMPVLLMMFFLLIVIFPGAPFWAVVGGLALYNGAIIGEILRAGLKALPRGQREAGLTIGLTSLSTRILIEFPQAFKQMTPIIVAQLVVLLKDTSLGYIVSYPELVRKTMNHLATYYGTDYRMSFFLVTLVIYLAINMLVSTFARYLSKRMTK
ncbi:MAG: amino acid ABC transporter permease [Microbacteriaceae bacterium]|nr:amino acid ABC transporter permease [Microbacteriaceae bacterium]